MVLSSKKELLSPNLALDLVNFFTANLQTAFGPFIAIYLAQRSWTQSGIGLALGAGSIAGMAAQIPAGALVDAVRNKARAAGAAILAIIAGALILALAPTTIPVLAAEISHAFASCMLSPAIAAISLDVAGAQPGERLGRNARFASVGNGTAAGLMAVAGGFAGTRTIFLLGAALAIPGLFALRLVPSGTAAPAQTVGGRPTQGSVLQLLVDRRLRWFAAACALFHLSNAFMLPLAAGVLAGRLGNRATLVIGACIVGPQIIVALLSPAVGRAAERWGRRPVLAAGMSALPLRGLALAALFGGGLPAWLLIPIQLLDGCSGAMFGVLMPLAASDITRGTGRFNLCMGLLGLAVGAAASGSSFAFGSLADRSIPWAFAAMAGAGAAGVLVAWLMPDTRAVALAVQPRPPA